MSTLLAGRRLDPRRLDLPAVARALVPSPRLRLRLGAGLAVLALLAAIYLMWARDSGLVRVEEVKVTGVTGRDADRVEAALEGAGRQMTTLHVDRDRLEQVTEAFPSIRSLDVSTDFPHGLRIHVILHRPAAVVLSGERRVPVAADGTILTGLPVEGKLPEIELDGALPPKRLGSGSALEAVRLAGAAPAVLLSRVEDVRREGERGLVAHLRDGPDLIFGGADRLEAKWAAAARVLADRDAAGAEYIDLRLPERPAAGGLAVETVTPVAPAGTGVAETPPPAEAAAPIGQDPAAVAPAADPTSPDGTAPQAAPDPAAPPASAPPAAPVQDPGGGAVANPQP